LIKIKQTKRQFAPNQALERMSLVCMPKGRILAPPLSAARYTFFLLVIIKIED
jgi:hypothetical protein